MIIKSINLVFGLEIDRTYFASQTKRTQVIMQTSYIGDKLIEASYKNSEKRPPILDMADGEILALMPRMGLGSTTME